MNKILLWYIYILAKMSENFFYSVILAIPVTILFPYMYLLAVLEDLRRIKYERAH